ncbi:MAG: hypothetical protein AB7L92_08130 [Alphaproteobacteria bacterium]
MRMLWLLLALTLPLAACGHKGKLKTPEQIEHEQAKKERKAAKEIRKKEAGQAEDAYTRESQQAAPEGSESQ